MISIPARLGIAAVGPRRLAAHLDRAGYFYVFGTRSFCCCVPLVFRLFGPQLLALYRLAKAPTGEAYSDLQI